MSIKDQDTRDVLRHLWGAHAVKIDLRPEGGYIFAHHERDPTAPRSPVRIDLRTANHPTKPGPLLPVHVDMLGRIMWKKLERSQISFNGICGIPNAGVPLADAMRKEAYYSSNRDVPLALLEKFEQGGKRLGGRLQKAEGLPRKSRILLTDDVVTTAISKQWPTEVLRFESFIVEDCLVAVYREEGGKEGLARLGLRLHYVVTLREMLTYYREVELISSSDYEALAARLQWSLAPA